MSSVIVQGRLARGGVFQYSPVSSSAALRASLNRLPSSATFFVSPGAVDRNVPVWLIPMFRKSGVLSEGTVSDAVRTAPVRAALRDRGDRPKTPGLVGGLDAADRVKRSLVGER